MMIKKNIPLKNNIFIASPIKDTFSDAYLSIRKKEQRIYEDRIVKQFPYTENTHLQHQEWKLRQKSTDRFVNYLNKNSKKNLLEIGCGNGWFTHQCAQQVDFAIGIDINLPELEQATRLFNNDRLKFMYWDIFSDSPFEKQFDVIVLNAVIQYFPEIEVLKERLLEFLTLDGELHFIDSPFYEDSELDPAKQRSKNYYTQMGVPEMTEHYYHHSKDAIKGFELLYNPQQSKLARLFKGKDIPFGWYRFVKNDKIKE